MSTDEDIERQRRRIKLLEISTKGEPWTRENCEEAIALGMITREEVDAFFAFIDTLRARNYRPWYMGGIECNGVDIRDQPRTRDGGFMIPSRLEGVLHRGKGVHFYDMGAPTESQFVQWVGQERATGRLVAHTRRVPTDWRRDYSEIWPD